MQGWMKLSFPLRLVVLNYLAFSEVAKDALIKHCKNRADGRCGDHGNLGLLSCGGALLKKIC
ncbi:MAG: hypothetical protein ACLVEX_02110 [Ruthenibacterium lactatiformans]